MFENGKVAAGSLGTVSGLSPLVTLRWGPGAFAFFASILLGERSKATPSSAKRGRLEQVSFVGVNQSSGTPLKGGSHFYSVL